MSKSRQNLKIAIGSLVEFAMPWIADEIDSNTMTERALKLKKCVVLARSYRAKSKGDTKQLERSLSTFWKTGTGDKFHDRFNVERFELFLKLHAYIIDDLVQTVEESKALFSRIVEIGCGDGQVLKYCDAKFSDLLLTGLDINDSAIRLAKRNLSRGQNRIEFIATDALPWLLQNPKPGTVLMTNGGVLEYFSQPSVIQLFDYLARSMPTAVVLVEPLSPDHNLSIELDSIVFGSENSFSHNYPALLERSGFTIKKQHVFTAMPTRWIVILATKS